MPTKTRPKFLSECKLLEIYKSIAQSRNMNFLEADPSKIRNRISPFNPEWEDWSELSDFCEESDGDKIAFVAVRNAHFLDYAGFSDPLEHTGFNNPCEYLVAEDSNRRIFVARYRGAGSVRVEDQKTSQAASKLPPQDTPITPMVSQNYKFESRSLEHWKRVYVFIDTLFGR